MASIGRRGRVHAEERWSWEKEPSIERFPMIGKTN